MRAPARVAAFGVALGVAFGVAALAGAALEPLRDDDDRGHGEAHGEAHPPAASEALELVAEERVLPLARTATFAFRIADARGRAVTDFDVEHERRMHLIVVRQDLTGFQHVHPTMDAGGRWTVRLRLPEAGVYRAYADFTAAGASRTLAMDLSVGGPFRPATLPAPAPVATTDGYAVRLDAEAQAGGESALAYDVRRDGDVAPDIEPYLGADGHLVALREHDLAFLHVHPEPTGGVPGRIRFAADLPSAGRYRLFLQFKDDGVVHTVAHTIEIAR